MKQVRKERFFGFYKNKWACLLLLGFIILISCTNQENKTHNLILDSRYSQIRTIEAFAKCEGPTGKYTTKIESSVDGSFFFMQEFGNDEPLFKAKIDTEGKGFVLNKQDVIIDTLSKEGMVMIKSHDFHRLHTNPTHFFQDIAYENNIDENIELYQAKDGLDNPVKIYYSRNKQLIPKIELLNPFDTSQVIEIINEEWMESDYGQLVKKLYIIQAKKDTFYFDYESVEIKK